jgi:DHA3 family macrolide efflux protein-like MFS transporter
MRTRLAGLPGFVVVCLGQTISMLGSGLTAFAVGVWVYHSTGSVTRFALVTFCAVAPLTFLSPLAGAVVDRFDRRWVMVVSDAGAGAASLALALLFWSGRVELWSLCAAMVWSSVCRGLRFPALAASIPLMVGKEHLGRANGMLEIGNAASQLLAPLTAGFLVGAIQIRGVILLDVASFAAAILSLLAVRIPNPPRQQAAVAGPPRRRQLAAAAGWVYIRERRGLLGLLALAAAINLTIGLVQTLIQPLVLSFASAAVLGAVLSTSGVGMLAGGVIMAVWGGPRRRLAAIVGLLLLQSVALLAGGARASAVTVGAAAFLYLLCLPIVISCTQAIWQTKVPPEVLGRVFAIRQMTSAAALPVAFLVAGPLADRLFEPLLAVHGPLAGSVGRLIGVGPGRGIGLLFITLGVFLALAAAAARACKPLWRLEIELPDRLPAPAPALESEPRAAPLGAGTVTAP